MWAGAVLGNVLRRALSERLKRLQSGFSQSLTLLRLIIHSNYRQKILILVHKSILDNSKKTVPPTYSAVTLTWPYGPVNLPTSVRIETKRRETFTISLLYPNPSVPVSIARLQE